MQQINVNLLSLLTWRFLGVMARGGRRGRPKVRRKQLEVSNQAPDSQEVEECSNNISRTIMVDPMQQINGTVAEPISSPSIVFPSYASMVDPNEGTMLEFISATDMNGTKCAKLVEENVEGEIDYWQNAVICCVLGANPLYEVIDGLVRRNWTGLAIDKVLLIEKGLYLVRFLDKGDAVRVAQKGVYHFDQKPFIVKAWTLEMEINVDSITSLPIWIQLPELDIKYWGMQSLSKLGSVIGIPLKTDRYTKDKSMLKYARLLVEMPLEGHFPDYIDFANEKNVIIRQKIVYE